MEYNLEKKLIPGQVTVLDSVQEQPIDIDFTLPDYCPDIEKILKCSLQPKIFSRNISGGQLQIDGIAVVKVLYCDSLNKHIRCTEQNVPFSAAFTAKTAGMDYTINTATKCEYLNCRALSPRRLTIHGAFSLYARVEEKSGVALTCAVEEPALETETKKISCSELIAFSQDLFTVSEEINIQNKPKIEVLLRDSLKAAITSIKFIQDKVIVKGDLNLKVLYLSDIDSGEIEQIDYLLPFNQLLDTPGIDEEAKNSLQLEILSYDIRVKSDALSENPIILLDTKMALAAAGYKDAEETVILDAYSTEYATEFATEKLPLVSNIENIDESFMTTTSVELENEKVSKIIDIYNEFCTLNFAADENLVTFSGKLNVCILAMGEDDVPFYSEKTIDFEHITETATAANILANTKAEVLSISYRLGEENTVEVRAEINISGTAISRQTYECITEVSADEEKRIEKSKSALTLYFASKGEKLWDIAKHYNTRVSQLTAENAIEATKLENAQMLLIPTV